VLAVERPARDGGRGLIAAINMGRDTVALPAEWGTDVLLASDGAVTADTASRPAQLLLPPETACWLST
jgi:hypothetical protein